MNHGVVSYEEIRWIEWGNLCSCPLPYLDGICWPAFRFYCESARGPYKTKHVIQGDSELLYNNKGGSYGDLGQKMYIKAFTDSPLFPRNVFTFIIVSVNFYKVETIIFNVRRNLNSLFAMKQRYYVLRSSFNRHFVEYSCLSNFEYGETCQICYRYYCFSLLTVLQLSTPQRALNIVSPLKRSQK
jgi:hypothetical protein